MTWRDEMWDEITGSALFPPQGTPQPRGANSSKPTPEPTMLQRARTALNVADIHRQQADGNAYHRSKAEDFERRAATLAALAQAEALTRIADVLEDAQTAGELDSSVRIWGSE